jgi:hypothetical protein
MVCDTKYNYMSFQILLLALSKVQLLSDLYTYIHSFICNIKSEINLHLEISVYIKVRGIFIFFHIVPAALYGCYVYLEEKRTALDKVLV